MVLAGFFTGKLKSHQCSEEMNDAWGCYTPARRPRWNLPCVICMGNNGNTDCEICGGQGAVGQDRCPNHVNTGTMDRLFSAYATFRNHNALPIAGGTLDQTRYFHRVIDIFPSYELAWDKVEEETRRTLEALNKGRKKGK